MCYFFQVDRAELGLSCLSELGWAGRGDLKPLNGLNFAK